MAEPPFSILPDDEQNQPGHPSQTKTWFDAVLESPVFAGVLALIALAIGFSPRASTLGTWVCLAAAWLLLARMVYMLDHVRVKPRAKRWKITGLVSIGAFVVLTAFGLWLMQPLKSTLAQLTSNNEGVRPSPTPIAETTKPLDTRPSPLAKSSAFVTTTTTPTPAAAPTPTPAQVPSSVPAPTQAQKALSKFELTDVNLDYDADAKKMYVRIGIHNLSKEFTIRNVRVQSTTNNAYCSGALISLPIADNPQRSRFDINPDDTMYVNIASKLDGVNEIVSKGTEPGISPCRVPGRPGDRQTYSLTVYGDDSTPVMVKIRLYVGPMGNLEKEPTP